MLLFNLRRHSLYFILGLLFLLKAPVVGAVCPIADKVARESTLDKAMPLYINCALQKNDDDSQP